MGFVSVHGRKQAGRTATLLPGLLHDERHADALPDVASDVGIVIPIGLTFVGDTKVGQLASSSLLQVNIVQSITHVCAASNFDAQARPSGQIVSAFLRYGDQWLLPFDDVASRSPVEHQGGQAGHDAEPAGRCCRYRGPVEFHLPILRCSARPPSFCPTRGRAQA